MSRTHNERSIPNARGRKGELKSKRRSHRSARGMSDIEDIGTAKHKYAREYIDRETKQKNRGTY